MACDLCRDNDPVVRIRRSEPQADKIQEFARRRGVYLGAGDYQLCGTCLDAVFLNWSAGQWRAALRQVPIRV